MNDLDAESRPTAVTRRTDSTAARTSHELVAIRVLRSVALLEGVSYLALLAIAMPLKYFAGMPTLVQITGIVHGVLFLLYVAAVAYAAMWRRWPLGYWLGNLLAAFLPFGPFVADPFLRREQREIKSGVDLLVAPT